MDQRHLSALKFLVLIELKIFRNRQSNYITYSIIFPQNFHRGLLLHKPRDPNVQGAKDTEGLVVSRISVSAQNDLLDEGHDLSAFRQICIGGEFAVQIGVSLAEL